jgi:hypothetical protein
VRVTADDAHAASVEVDVPTTSVVMLRVPSAERDRTPAFPRERLVVSVPQGHRVEFPLASLPADVRRTLAVCFSGN